MPRFVFYIVLMACWCPLWAQEAEPIETGVFTAAFDSRSPLTDPDAMSRGMTRAGRNQVRSATPHGGSKTSVRMLCEVDV